MSVPLRGEVETDVASTTALSPPGLPNSVRPLPHRFYLDFHDVRPPGRAWWGGARGVDVVEVGADRGPGPRPSSSERVSSALQRPLHQQRTLPGVHQGGSGAVASTGGPPSRCMRVFRLAIVMPLARLGGVGGACRPRWGCRRSPGTPSDGLTTPWIVIPVPYGGVGGLDRRGRGPPTPSRMPVGGPHAPTGGLRGPDPG